MRVISYFELYLGLWVPASIDRMGTSIPTCVDFPSLMTLMEVLAELTPILSSFSKMWMS
jgi:hypothetical protein